MFSGEYEYKVDEKGRVPVPPRFREDLKGKVYLGQGVDKCIRAYSKTAFDNLVQLLGPTVTASAKMRELQRFLVGRSFELELDGQGRVMIPAALREYAGIKDTVVVVGIGDIFEIWNPQLLEPEKTKDAEEAWQIIENLQVQKPQ